MDTASEVTPSLALNSDQQAIYEMALDFAGHELSPTAIEWDHEKHFPINVLRRGAALGFGGIYISDRYGGSGLTRLDAALIFEALAMAARQSRRMSRSTKCRPG